MKEKQSISAACSKSFWQILLKDTIKEIKQESTSKDQNYLKQN